MDSLKIPPTDSRFYPSDCKCSKNEVTSDVLIECMSCIENSKMHGSSACRCRYHTIVQMICTKCAYNRDKLDNMHIEFDNLIQKLSRSAKSYTNCYDTITSIYGLTKQMRQCNKELLSQLDFQDENNSTIFSPEVSSDEESDGSVCN
jgi:hypothetical protein